MRLNGVQQLFHQPVDQLAGDGEILNFVGFAFVARLKHGVKAALALMPQTEFGTQTEMAGLTGVDLQFRRVEFGKPLAQPACFFVQQALVFGGVDVMLVNLKLLHERADPDLKNGPVLYGLQQLLHPVVHLLTGQTGRLCELWRLQASFRPMCHGVLSVSCALARFCCKRGNHERRITGITVSAETGGHWR